MREQEQQYVSKLSLDPTVRATPIEGKRCIRDDTMNDTEHHILRSSNSINSPMSLGSTLPKGNIPFHGTRKRLSRNSEPENNSLNDKKGRHSDPPKPFSRVARTTVKQPVVTTSKRPVAHNQTTRDPVQAIKERENKKRIWSR